MMKRVILLMALWAVSPALSLTLVEDGRGRALIVTAAQPAPAAAEGAALLAAQLQRICGCRLAIAAEGELENARVEHGRIYGTYQGTQPAAFVLVGESQLTQQLGIETGKLGPSGIRIKSLTNALALLGADEREPTGPDGSRYAVITFLEEALGCRMLWPGELGLIAPAQRTLRIDPLDITFTPPILQRGIRNSSYNSRVQEGLDHLGLPKKLFMAKQAITHQGTSQLPTWFQWQRLGGDMQIKAGHAFGFMWSRQHKEHPEWFAMQPNGSRDLTNLRPERSRLCKSNRELIDYLARVKLAEMRQQGTISASLCPNDGAPGTFCMCPECRKLDPESGRPIILTDCSGEKARRFEYVSLTDRMVWFWNHIAEQIVAEVPHARLGVYAYSAYRAPPLREQLHPSLVVGFVGGDYASDKERLLTLSDWDAWAEKARRIYWRPNLLLLARRTGVPALYPRKLHADLNRFVASGALAGTDFDSCMHNWATEGLNYYVLARLLWNPALDVDALIDDYCRAGFGAAHAQVRAYFERIEALTSMIAAREGEIATAYTPQTVRELSALLQEAAAVDENPQVRQRIAFLACALPLAELQYRTYRFARKNPRGELPPAARETIFKLQQAKDDLMRQIFREHPLAINLPIVAWSGERRFHKYGWHGAATAPPQERFEADRAGNLKD